MTSAKARAGASCQLRASYYLAALSRTPEAVARAKQCMADLAALGLTNSYDWTTNLLDPQEKWGDLAVIDLARACSATVFVMLASPETPGGMCELGARLALGGVADVVGGEHLFFHHPRVVRHATWSAFLEMLAT